MSKDHPFEDVASMAFWYMQAGHTVFQKFTCVKCGSRQTMAEPNKFFELGTCEECSHVTDLKKHGCNFLLAMEMRNATKAH